MADLKDKKNLMDELDDFSELDEIEQLDSEINIKIKNNFEDDIPTKIDKPVNKISGNISVNTPQVKLDDNIPASKVVVNKNINNIPTTEKLVSDEQEKKRFTKKIIIPQPVIKDVKEEVVEVKEEVDVVVNNSVLKEDTVVEDAKDVASVEKKKRIRRSPQQIAADLAKENEAKAQKMAVVEEVKAEPVVEEVKTERLKPGPKKGFSKAKVAEEKLQEAEEKLQEAEVKEDITEIKPDIKDDKMEMKQEVKQEVKEDVKPIITGDSIQLMIKVKSEKIQEIFNGLPVVIDKEYVEIPVKISVLKVQEVFQYMIDNKMSF